MLSSPLVSVDWLSEHLDDPSVLVVDTSVFPGSGGYLSGHETYLLHGHVPGAVFADLIEQFSDPSGEHPFTRPNAARFAAAAGVLGIGEHTTVIAYDAVHNQWATRFWWLLRAFGHDRVAVLDGGLTAWRSEGGAVQLGNVTANPQTFAARERPGLWVDKSAVERVVAGTDEGLLVCSVPPKEFSGEVAPRHRAGHIPGSVSVPAGRLVEEPTRRYRPDAELRALLAPASGRRVIAYCGGGIAATSAAFALTLLGERDVAVYDGSLNEWSADPSAPLTTLDSTAPRIEQ